MKLLPNPCHGLIFGFAYAGVEARGFIFGPPIALAIGAKFVPMRKPNKLPGTSFLPLFLPYGLCHFFILFYFIYLFIYLFFAIS